MRASLYFMDYLKLLTLPASNLLHCVIHDTDNTHVWVFLVDADNNDDKQGKMQWVVTDRKPVKAGRDSDPRYVGGRLYVDVKVKEVFTDTGDLLKAENTNGFHSWKQDRQADASQYVFTGLSTN